MCMYLYHSWLSLPCTCRYVTMQVMVCSVVWRGGGVYQVGGRREWIDGVGGDVRHSEK